MKFIIKNILCIILLSCLILSCSKDKHDTNNNINSEKLIKVTEFSNDNHVIEIYSFSDDTLSTGYNDVLLKIKDKNSNDYIKNADIKWLPVMIMSGVRKHSCPRSEIIEKPTSQKDYYRGFMVFQMITSDENNYWEIDFSYKINGIDYKATSKINVKAGSKRTLNNFTANGKRYLLVYMQTDKPKVAINDITIGIFTPINNMMDFQIVDSLIVKLDPRMPVMGNHGSPNNQDAVQKNIGGFYYGKLSLTMTGYWKINLQLLDEKGNMLKGKVIDSNNESSDIFFDIEF